MLTGLVWLLVLLGVDLTGTTSTPTSFKNLWQLVPYENLTADPFGSVWNLHIQPPLWNLAIGLIGRWSPLPESISFVLFMASFGSSPRCCSVTRCDASASARVGRWR